MQLPLISRLREITRRISERLDRFRSYIDMWRAEGIIRRYFGANAFDGAMTTLGILIGAYVTGSLDPSLIVGITISTSIALGTSGIFAVYLIESAERQKSLEELESAVLVDLQDTLLAKASRFVSSLTALVDGIAPVLIALIGISPFLICLKKPYPVEYAAISSLIIIFMTLFALGYMIGAGNLKQRSIYGIKMLIAGIIATFLSILLKQA
ncbi:MAG: hypothetical protein DRN90_04540 [Thermoproteota archaeon]|nr:MAG: hypothetical protein DRN90_04540 [Candidatus Korarchaeota archaeon]